MALTKGNGPTQGSPQDLINKLAALNSAGGSGMGQERVYMGTETKLRRKSGRADAYVRRTVPNYMSIEDASKAFFQWDDKKRKDFMSQAIVGGLLKPGAGIMEASSLWGTLVKESARYTAAGTDFSPWDVLGAYTKQAGGAGAWVRQGDWEINTFTHEKRYVGPQFKTTTQNSVDFTDPATARAIATGVFQDMLGRDPTKNELASFATALKSAEFAHPEITKTTTEYNSQGEPVGTKVRQTGGMSAAGRQMVGKNQVKKDDEYGAYQAATTYQNALESAVFGSPG